MLEPRRIFNRRHSRSLGDRIGGALIKTLFFVAGLWVLAGYALLATTESTPSDGTGEAYASSLSQSQVLAAEPVR